jgi:hypothetical protein
VGLRNFRSVLYLDDVRVPTIFGIDVVQNYDQFVWFLRNNPMPELISFDHDLDITHLPLFEEENTRLREGIPYDTYTEKTGLECARFVIENQLPLLRWAVHSRNPVGRMNIERELRLYCPEGEVQGLSIPFIAEERRVYGDRVVDGYRRF